jgi:integrase
MASLHRQEGKPFWFAAFAVFNPATNRWQRVFRSTKTKDKNQAHEIMRSWDKAAQLAYTGKLSIDAAREVIAEGVRDVFMKANAALLPSASIKSWCETWLASKKIEVEESTYVSYKIIIQRFIDFIGDAASNRDIATLDSTDIARFRNQELTQLARGTVNLRLAVLRICFGEAVRQGLLTLNPGDRVDNLKSSAESKRRAFTLPEIQRILKACDTEWRGLVLFGLYTGQRLGDLARLTWRAVDLEADEIAFVAKKTGRRIVLPLMPALSDYLASLPASDDPNAPIFPRSAAMKTTGTLSCQFREVLVEAGLAEPYQSRRGNKRSTRRDTSDISFHSFRHSATSMLKNAGVSNALAMAIIGHESEAVSRTYTHHSTDDLRRAMAKLPDVSTTTKAKRTKK